MNPGPSTLRDDRARIREEAWDWLVRLDETGADSMVAERSRRWRAADPEHESAFRLAERTWRALPETEATVSWTSPVTAVAPEDTPLTFFGKLTRRRCLLAMTVPASIAVAASAVFLVLGKPTTGEVIETPVGQVRQIALDDGSRIDLGARSRVKVQMEDGERRVALEEGQAFFDVAHDVGRPFVVMAGGTEIRVTGTKFDVWRKGDEVHVGVLEGSVVMRRVGKVATGSSAHAIAVRAGDVASVEQDRIAEAPRVPGQAQPGEWRTGRLYYADAPLGDVVADANRYSAIPIRLQGEGVAELRVTLSFRTGAVDQLINGLEDGLPLRVRRGPDEVVIEPR